MKKEYVDNGTMLNVYPDSIGGNLSALIDFLKKPEMKEVFQALYVLPSIFNTDLDRGFSVIDYSLNELLVKKEDLNALEQLSISLKLDLVLNHVSVLSPQFQDILRHGEESVYRDFFINWNKFWQGHGEMTKDGYIQPKEELIRNAFFRKPGLPLLMVRMPDGKNVPYWNTFYQEIRYREVDEQDLVNTIKMQFGSASVLKEIINRSLGEGKIPRQIELGRFEPFRKQITELLETNKKYLGQMDLNIESPLVWEYYDQTLKKLSQYGAKIVRLDAFAYAAKSPGKKNFLNDPETWELLSKVQNLANQYNLELLPEIHAGYEEKIYVLLSQRGYLTYDFFLPGLILDALEQKNGAALAEWAEELYANKIRIVNMLGCHDGIPLLDLKGMIPEKRIEDLMDTIVKRGGFVKNLYGRKVIYYQINATYYSAVGEDDRKMLLARAIQLFMPGKAQVWYLDFFMGKNDYEAMKYAGSGGHKEINRTNLSLEEIQGRMQREAVQKQIAMLRFRNTFPAFGFDSELQVWKEESLLRLIWSRENHWACLEADLKTCDFIILGINEEGKKIFECRNIH